MTEQTATCTHDWQWLIKPSPDALNWCRLCGALKSTTALVLPVAAKRESALREDADALAKALDFCAAAIDEVRANVGKKVVTGRPDWEDRFDPHSRMAADALTAHASLTGERE